MPINTAEFGQDLLRRTECKVMQHDDDILCIAGALLSRHRLVESFSDAAAGAGGWGATSVILRTGI
jgi:hypothetical protein